MKKGPLLLLGAGWLIFMLAVTACLSLARGSDGSFDQATWLARRNGGFNNPRRLMVDGIKELLPPGTPKAEVLALLGPPDGPGRSALEYHLADPLLGVESLYLAIYFDERQRVAEISVIER